jgi:predicted metal-binding membrane protein
MSTFAVASSTPVQRRRWSVAGRWSTGAGLAREAIVGAVFGALAWTVVLLSHADVGVSWPSARTAAGPGSSPTAGALAHLAHAVVTPIAMMWPVLAILAVYVRRNALTRRRYRAMAAASGAYLAVWAAFHGVVEAVVQAVMGIFDVSSLRVAPITAAALAVAALWQFMPAKKTALRACHRPGPLRLSGAAALHSELVAGLRLGGACLGSCWAFMIPMALPQPSLLAMGTGSAVLALERLHRRPRFARQAAAAMLMAAALGILILNL